METLGASVATALPSSSPLSIFSPKRNSPSSIRSPHKIHLCVQSGNENESDLRSDPSTDATIVPILNDCFSISPLSKDAAMGLVLSAATGRGWTTGSGMEGPSIPAGVDPGNENISTFPWSLFTKSPRRRMLVAFSCNICGQRTTRAINPHAYNDGTVFVQCCGCNVFHKLVDNLNLFHEMKCYISPSFNYGDANGVSFKYLDFEDGEDDDDAFPVL
ncbi:hypothetical protein Sjap_009850 [Stephania japonica]|uniref:DNL-type domain-containing protein n=1 Tax=Stephania japonica TaxID=461633 RepID=A0AAP0JAM2_9MAGN